MLKLIFLILVFASPKAANAFELEAFAGANSTTYDDAPEAKTYGVSVRTKMNFYSDNSGVFTNLNCRGQSFFVCDAMVGYGWRSSGDWFWEIGPGFMYSAIYGPAVSFLAGTGFRITSNFFVNFPIIANMGANNFIFWSPYLGFQF